MDMVRDFDPDEVGVFGGVRVLVQLVWGHAVLKSICSVKVQICQRRYIITDVHCFVHLVLDAAIRVGSKLRRKGGRDLGCA
ncbi:hypothetical protein NPIL_65911 [Nephila pilipes]|uniref:Uncharacterized protein n=1 Tax=Nephila pilipes TaxID=299642 RepID=A0A8X6QNB5_NEPPI|nr:hypothetical protein NPIL_65911 [Nephila pilipes]